jgi:hypothetical protein
LTFTLEAAAAAGGAGAGAAGTTGDELGGGPPKRFAIALKSFPLGRPAGTAAAAAAAGGGGAAGAAVACVVDACVAACGVWVGGV